MDLDINKLTRVMAVCIRHFYEQLDGEEPEELDGIWDNVIESPNLSLTLDFFDNYDIEDEYGYSIYFCIKLGLEVGLNSEENLTIATRAPTALMKEKDFIDGTEKC